MSGWLCPACMQAVKEYAEICPHCGHLRDEKPDLNPLKYQYNSTSAKLLLPVGTLLKNGRYLVGMKKGCGANATVYVGLDLVLQKRIAIKELLPCNKAEYRDQASHVLQWKDSLSIEAYHKRFQNEALMMTKADGLPGFSRVYDLFYENNTAYIVENYIEGRTLSEIKMRSPLAYPREKDPGVWLKMLYSIMRSLEQLHRLGIVHNDVNENNVLIDRYGNSWIVDFGRANPIGTMRDLGAETIQNRFIAPELIKSWGASVGPWTDVYCVCAMFARLKGYQNLIKPDYTLDPQVIPEKYHTVFTRGLAAEPRDRIQNMDELAEAFRLAEDGSAPKGGKTPRSAGTPGISVPQPLRRLSFLYGQIFNSESEGCLIYESGYAIGQISDFMLSFHSKGTIHISGRGFGLSSEFAAKESMKGVFPNNREEFLRRDYIITTGSYEQGLNVEIAKLIHQEDGFLVCFDDFNIRAQRGSKSWTFILEDITVARIEITSEDISLLAYKQLTELQIFVLSFFTWPYMN